MLSAIMGANSAGKSTLLLALNTFFGAAVKLDPSLFHDKSVDEPIVIEVTLVGEIEQPNAWHAAYCLPTKKGTNGSRRRFCGVTRRTARSSKNA